jgi:hypothetical protein
MLKTPEKGISRTDYSSSAAGKIFTHKPRRPEIPEVWPELSVCEVFGSFRLVRQTGNALIKQVQACGSRDSHREGASRVSTDRSATRLREPRGTGASDERPCEGGPTGTTDLFSGAVAVSTHQPTGEVSA